MWFQAIIVAGALLPSMSFAFCWKDEVSKPNKQVIVDAIPIVANSMGGFWKHDQKRTACVSNMAAGHHWYIEVQKKSSSDGSIPQEKIRQFLMDEVNNCDAGGVNEKESNRYE